MRISDWSSDVCSSDLFVVDVGFATVGYMLTMRPLDAHIRTANPYASAWAAALICYPPFILMNDDGPLDYRIGNFSDGSWMHWFAGHRSEEHTSELQSLMRISYAVFCLKKTMTYQQPRI